jgi:hypothetical protein
MSLGSFNSVGVAGELPVLLSICSSVRLSTRTSVWLSMTCHTKPFTCVSEAGHGRQSCARLSDRGASMWIAMRRVAPCSTAQPVVGEGPTKGLQRANNGDTDYCRRAVLANRGQHGYPRSKAGGNSHAIGRAGSCIAAVDNRRSGRNSNSATTTAIPTRPANGR